MVRYLHTPGSYKHSHEQMNIEQKQWLTKMCNSSDRPYLWNCTIEIFDKIWKGSLLHKFAYNWNSIFWWMKKTVQRDFHYLYSILKIYPTMQMGKKGNKYRYNCICGTYKLYLQAIQLYLQAIQKQYALGITAVLFSLS